MKVVHISSSDCNGGAARSAYRLHQGLRELGLDSKMFVSQRYSQDCSVSVYEPPTDFKSRLRRAWRRNRTASEVRRYTDTAPGIFDFAGTRANFSLDRAQYGGDPWQHLPENDLIQLHWVAGFLDYESFFASLDTQKPVVWTLHDMVAFTGGCHWDYGCGKFAQECGACPQLGSKNESDLTHQVWQRKQKSFQRLRPHQAHIVTPSRWLGSEVKRSSLLSHFPCSVIPYGLDTQVFAPRERRAAREMLGIPLEKRVMLFVAHSPLERRKGFGLLAEVLAGLETEPDLLVLSVGAGQPDLPAIPHVHLGLLPMESAASGRILSFVYNAADIFVAPSLQDNLPNTVLESIACGVPVAAFGTGGIPDAVRPGVTGLLARPGDVGELRDIILRLLRNHERRAEMSVNCRKIALQEYSLEVQARCYLKLYEVITKDGYCP